jgi:excisionase family DNA binding protein
MSQINAEHLSRAAVVYIRQSTADQVQHNLESQRRQYALADRARELGWSQVLVIDDDLGRSGSGVHRPGFERLLAQLCHGEVGAVFCIEASRLARNGRDWHTLLEFCRLVNALLIDEDGIYDARSANDRLLLGMKGTISEMELSTLRARSQAGLEQKARRGELYTVVPIGFVRTEGDRLEHDPDQRVREAIALVFGKFRELGTVRQVLMWLRQERIELPANRFGPSGWHKVWKLPVYNTVLKILTNPTYAGAYVFGRTKSIARIVDGRKQIYKGQKLEQDEWGVLLKEHHAGYISWEDYQTNLRTIANNAQMQGSMVQGAARRGQALLGGLLRCGHCGRKLHVAYSGVRGDCVRYDCRGNLINHGSSERCISFGGLRAEQRVAEEVLRQLQPLGLRAALAAIDQRAQACSEQLRHKELALQQARFEVARARRQYDAVDPDNRLVASELERRWNETLRTQATIEEELEVLRREQPQQLSEPQREQLVAMGEDIALVWNHPHASVALKKRVLRSVLEEIVVRVAEQRIEMVLHWCGGDHTALEFAKNRTGQHRWATDQDLVALVRALARQMPDGLIAAMLNRMGKRTVHGHTWNRTRVATLRNEYQIAVYRDGERAQRGELTLEEAAAYLNLNAMAMRRMIARSEIAANQFCAGAPWVIRRSDLDALRDHLPADPGPLTANEQQLGFDLQ